MAARVWEPPAAHAGDERLDQGPICPVFPFIPAFYIPSFQTEPKEEEKGNLIRGCKNLVITSMEIGNRAGWNVLRHISN